MEDKKLWDRRTRNKGDRIGVALRRPVLARPCVAPKMSYAAKPATPSVGHFRIPVHDDAFLQRDRAGVGGAGGDDLLRWCPAPPRMMRQMCRFVCLSQWRQASFWRIVLCGVRTRRGQPARHLDVRVFDASGRAQPAQPSPQDMPVPLAAGDYSSTSRAATPGNETFSLYGGGSRTSSILEKRRASVPRATSPSRRANGAPTQ
jgi:hypothetical protein